MSQGPLCPNLTKKFRKEASQRANRNFSCAMLLGGLSVNLNHLKMCYAIRWFKCKLKPPKNDEHHFPATVPACLLAQWPCGFCCDCKSCILLG